MTEHRRALVTGGGGFLGSHLCRRLLGSDVQVLSLDNLSTSAPRADTALAGHPGYRFIRRDIADPLDPGELPEVGVIFHLASPASPVDYLRLPVQTLRTGALGTANVLALAERFGARLVLASTSEVYGDPLQHPQSETYWGNVNPIGPRSVYDEAKRFAEALTFAHRRAGDVDTGVARIFNTYGPGMRADDGRVVPTFCAQALSGRPLTVHGSGEQTRSLCYVDDTVDALIALAAADCAGPVNIGNPDELTVLQIAETIRDLAGSTSPVEFVPAQHDDPQRRCPDVSAAAELLGWYPRVTYKQGLAETIEWFAGRAPVVSDSK